MFGTVCIFFSEDDYRTITEYMHTIKAPNMQVAVMDAIKLANDYHSWVAANIKEHIDNDSGRED